MPALKRNISPGLLRLAGAAEPDAELLARFVRCRDEAAFTALVDRHGPMVLGVCRRILGGHHAAEDAFQAAFVALARNAGRLHDPGALAAWLYGAAVRVARNARRAAARTHLTARNAPMRTVTDPLSEITGRELVAAIDEELARLPEAFRAPVVLCCLEGLSQDEAARRLGWSPGSVKGRLERGRERLRQRLGRRGIDLSSVLALFAASRVTAAVPAELFAQAVRFAATGAASPAVTGLAKAAGGSGPLPKLVVVAFLTLTAGGIAALGGDPSQPGPLPKSKPAEPRSAVDAPRKVDRFGDPLPDGAVLRLGTVRLRHAKNFALAFTADKKLVSFGGDYVVRTWDPATGRQLSERAFERDPIHRTGWGGCFSPDVRRLATQCGDRVKVFDVESGRELAAVTVTNAFDTVGRFSPDGKLLAVADHQGKVQVCDVGANTARELARLGESGSNNFAFSRDGRHLALANFAHGAIVWDVATGREVLRYKPEGLWPWTVDFDASGDVLAIFSVLGAEAAPRSVHFVRVSTGRPPDGWSAPGVGEVDWTQVGWAQFAPDGSTVLFAGAEGLRWFDPKTGKTIRTAAGVPGRPAFSPDGRLVASVSRNTLALWDADAGRSAVPAELANMGMEEVHGVVVAPDGKWFLTVGEETGLIQAWDANGRPRVAVRSNRRGSRYPIFSPDGQHLYGTAPDAVALVRWDLPGGAESARYTFAEPVADQVYVYHFGLSADGRRLAAITQTVNRRPRPAAAGPWASEAATLTVWDTATAQRLESREVEPRRLFGYGAFSPDLRWYYCDEKPLSLTGNLDFRLDIPEKWRATQAAVSPDGRLVAQAMEELVSEGKGFRAESRGVVVHEAATGKQVLTLPAEQCGPIAFTPDGRGLIVTDPKAIIRWDLPTRQPVARHRAPGPFLGSYGYSFASSLAVTPDGTRAITGHVDTTALVWDLPAPARPVKALSEQQLAAAWDDLAGDDAGKAYAAVWALADGAADAVPFLRARLRPVAVPAPAEVRKLVLQLDAPAFAERESAMKALRQLGDAAAPILRTLLKTGLSAEQTQRVEQLLATADAPTLPPGDPLRQLRAAAALELAATADARTLLDELAGGAVEARLTREATVAVSRLRRLPR